MRFQHAGVGELGIDLHRADVGEDVQMGAQCEQTVFRTGGSRRVVPFGSPHGAEQNRVGRRGQFPHAVRQWSAVFVDGYAADVTVFEDEIVAKGATHGLHGFDAFGGYLGPDAVAAQYGDVEIHFANGSDS